MREFLLFISFLFWLRESKINNPLGPGIIRNRIRKLMGKATDSHGTLPDKRQGIETLSDPQPNNKLMYIAYIEYIE